MEVARVEDLDDAALDRDLRFIRDHSSPLFLDGELAGSGTFISWDDEFGILTAHHVPHNPKDSGRRFDFSVSSTQKLGLSLVEHAHRFELEMRNLRPVDIAGPIDPSDLERGPDLAVIRLGGKATVVDIAARKSFYRVSHRTDERLAASLRDDGIFVVCGAAQEEEEQTGPELGFTEVTMQNLTTFYGGLHRRFDRDGYQYAELSVQRTGVDDPPDNFGGVSGGGLWRVPVERDVPNGYRIGPPVLAGVVFFQRVDNRREVLRCHTGDAVYRHALAAVRKRP